MPQCNENHEIQLFSSAAYAAAVDARKRSAKCAIAHKQADDKADAALLNSCEAENNK
jgi:hypothetical protein